jgi:hypothetical protein
MFSNQLIFVLPFFLFRGRGPAGASWGNGMNAKPLNNGNPKALTRDSRRIHIERPSSSQVMETEMEQPRQNPPSLCILQVSSADVAALPLLIRLTPAQRDCQSVPNKA